MPRAQHLAAEGSNATGKKDIDSSVLFCPSFSLPPKEHHQNVVHEPNGREGQRKLRAKNSARWNVFRSGGRLPLFEQIERKLGPKSVTSATNSYRLLNS